jgi:uncharacterized repeat protein (TIGR03803 family)
VVLAVFAMATLATGTPATAQIESVLHSFNNSTNLKGGLEPNAPLVMDSAGNLYGTTPIGGTNCSSQDGCGTVFQLAPKAGGGWTETVLHNFNDNGKDGMNPQAGVILDSAGNLYGTTSGGGIYAHGTVFKVSPKPGGGWSEVVLHSFNDNGKDGYDPYSGLVFDKAGNLYGTTSEGGIYNHGTAFVMSPKVGGSGFTEVVLHNFISNKKDGMDPLAGLIFDGAGNLYGTTFYGGVYGYGTVYELSPAGGNKWTETVLYSFPNNIDGYSEYPLTLDSAGNLYGTTVGESTATYGTVFELTLSGGAWSEEILHEFCSELDCADGSVPVGAPIFDAAGNLYGVTRSGGPGKNPQGTVFELTSAGGSWTLTTLHTFGQSKNDGAMPEGGLIMDGSGNLYGTTYQGGFYGAGAVYEITP